MKITNIEIKEKDPIKFFNLSGTKMVPVILTLKNFFGITKTMTVFPTGSGPTYGSGSIIFLCYTDKMGKEIENEFSKQINNLKKNSLLL